jgi:flagellar operon protein
MAPRRPTARRSPTSSARSRAQSSSAVTPRRASLDSATLSRLQNGVDRAAAKGSRESVVLVDDVAFVVSVKARTVITAVDRASMRDHVFTNIDSAVLS